MGWRGACEVLHLQNGGGGRISFSHVEGGGGTTSLEIVFMW